MNLTFANKNPFSTFDFLGYFFPGALFMYLFYVLSGGIETDKGNVMSQLPLISFLKDIMEAHMVMGVFILVLLSYIIGHLLSYMSSITVELFYTWYYGYPTKYLLRKKDAPHEQQYLLNSDLGFRGMIGHLVVCFLLFPIVAGHFIFERLLLMSSFIGRSLDDKLIDSISEKVKQVCESIGYKNATPSDSDVHRVVMHYVYEHCRMHQVKFDNYVALYGLLRSVSFTFCLSFLYILYELMFCQDVTNIEVLNCAGIWASYIVFVLILLILICSVLLKKGFITAPNCVKFILGATDVMLCLVVVVIMVYIVLHLLTVPSVNKAVNIIMIIGMFFLTYLSYLGFAKFYRRFTLENFMALLICEQPRPFDNTVNLKTDEPITITIDHPTSLTAEIFRFLSDRSKGAK